jgi:hypothetical protein
MPPRGAPGRRSRAQNIAKPFRKFINLALDLEMPLNDAIHFVQAIRLMGHGMMTDRDDDGQSIDAVAGAALDRLDALKDAWLKIIRTIRG